METQYNQRNPAVKRLMKEAAELHERTELYHAVPLEDNLFEWHFTVRGPPDTDFDGGIYHGRILLPPEYPMKPPSIMLLTPNGRFETNKKICLSISGYHPESWQPSWSIRTALLAIIGFMPTHGGGAIGSLDYTAPERQKLARRSAEWRCSECGVRMTDALPPITAAAGKQISEANELATKVQFQDEESRKAATAAAAASSTTASNQDQTEATTETEGLRKRNVEASGASDGQANDTAAAAPAANQESRTETPSVAASPTTTTPSPAAAAAARIAAARQNVMFLDERRRDADDIGGTTHLVLIVLVSVMLAALLARRLLIANEYRFGEAN